MVQIRNTAVSRRDFLATAATASLAAGAHRISAARLAAGLVAIASGNGLNAVAHTVEEINSGADALDSVITVVNLVEENSK